MSIKELEEMLEKYHEIEPKCNISTKHICPHCQTEQNFEIDITPNVFEVLLK